LFLGPIQGDVLDARRDDIGENVPVGGHNAHPVTGSKHHHVEDQPIGNPQNIEGLVNPLLDRNLLRGVMFRRVESALLRCPIRFGALLVADNEPGTQHHDNDEEIQKVLPTDPTGHTGFHAVRGGGCAVVGGDKIGHRIQIAQPLGNEHQRHGCDDDNAQRDEQLTVLGGFFDHVFLDGFGCRRLFGRWWGYHIRHGYIWFRRGLCWRGCSWCRGWYGFWRRFSLGSCWGNGTWMTNLQRFPSGQPARGWVVWLRSRSCRWGWCFWICRGRVGCGFLTCRGQLW